MHTPMDETQRRRLCAMLIRKKQELLRAVRKSMAGRLEEDTRFAFEANQDIPDQSVDELRRHIDAALTGRRSEDIDAIDAALRRIEDGSYGICEECGEDIPAQRLAAMPLALCCVACQRILERNAPAGCGQGPAAAGLPEDDYLSDKD